MEVTTAAASYLRELTAQAISVFGERLTGVWLLGSGAYGGFGEGSDLDVQAATETAPTPRELEALIDLIVPGLPTCPAAGLELVLYHRTVLAKPVPPLRWSLNLNGGPLRRISVSTNPAGEPWHWFILDLAIGLDFSVTLHGTALTDVVGPIGRQVQLDAIKESMRWHQENEPNGPNHLGNAARALRYMETGEWGSKPAALTWLSHTRRTQCEALDQLRTQLEMN
jgi:hypothetical protein